MYTLIFLIQLLSVCLVYSYTDNDGNLPKVFLLGPMKSGSSSLWEFMIKHPQICPGVRKEINYIQDDELLKGLAEGLLFKDVQTCEERRKRRGYPLYDGGYAFQLQQFLQYFRRDQILILSDEDLFRYTARTMRSIQKFLGLEWNNYWYAHELPYDDHWGHPRFKGKVQCCKEMVPELGCVFRNASALHFEEFNEELMKLVNVSNKSPYEPPFRGFRELAYKVECTEESPRDLYDRKIHNSKYRVHC